MILVFGKTGQVGKELQSLEEVISLDRSQADLQNSKTCSEVINTYKPHAVINAAAYTAVDKAEDQEELATLINCYAPAEMAKACKGMKIPFIHLSTDYIYSGKGNVSFKPSDNGDPQNAYGRSKLLGEKAILKSDVIYAILRISWIISAHGNNFVKTMLNLSETHKRLNVVSDQIGGPTPAKDVAKACITIAKQLIDDPSKSGIYNFSGAPEVSWCNFANAIFNKAGRKTIVIPTLTSNYPTLAKRPLNSRLDYSLTKNTFKIKRPNWEDGLEEILKDLGARNDRS